MAVECGMIGYYKNKCKSALENKEVNAMASVALTSGGNNALICTLKIKQESWVLDSRASYHATQNQELSKTHVSRNLQKVYLCNDQPCVFIGKGVVKVRLNEFAWELKDVRHTPDLRRKLISVGQLTSEGYTTIFHGDYWKVPNHAITIARGKKSGSLYNTT